MTNTISITDVRGMFARYERANESAGLIPDGFHLVLSEGSKYYGNAYRVHLTGNRVKLDNGRYEWPNGTGHDNPPVGNDFLGMTKRDAYDSLADAARIIEDMTRANA